jgi:hypothetical protein
LCHKLAENSEKIDAGLKDMKEEVSGKLWPPHWNLMSLVDFSL